MVWLFIETTPTVLKKKKKKDLIHYNISINITIVYFVVDQSESLCDWESSVKEKCKFVPQLHGIM